MRRCWLGLITPGLAVILSLAAPAPPARAIEEFYKAFEAKYIKPESTKQNDVLLIIAFEQARCALCHPGDDKHTLSSYGAEVGWRVNKYDKGDKKKIRKALEEVGTLRVDSRNPKSPTYADLFKEGRLPAGPAH